MRISAIEIENFKGISERQRMEFKPITLIFGPNSIGKSHDYSSDYIIYT